MENLCHRCGASLGEDGAFCSACGTPQLFFEPSEETQAFAASLRQGYGTYSQTGVVWKPAIQAALMTSVPVALLNALMVSVVTRGCCLWVIVGSSMTVALYQRRIKLAAVDARIGARIGLVAGLLASFCTMLMGGAALLLKRYVLGQGPAMDHEALQFTEQMRQQALDAAKSIPDMPQQWSQWSAYLLTPDGLATMVLTQMSALVLGIVLFSILGGAVGARMFQRSPIRR